MKRKLLQTISVALILIGALFTSCTTPKNIQNIKNAGVVLKDSYSYYINDSLTFSYRFPGCCYKGIVNQKEIKENFQKVNKNLPVNHCIACFREGGSPDYVHFVFYYQHKKNTHNKWLNAIKRSSENFYANENKYVVGKYLPLENNKGSIYIIGHISNFSNDNYHNVKVNNVHYDYFNYNFSILKANYEDIFNSIKTNAQYRDITFSSPFDIAKEWEMLEDSTINYVMPVFQLKNHEENYKDNLMNRGTWIQAYGTFISRLSNEEKEVLSTAAEFRNPYDLKYNVVSSNNALKTDEAALHYLIEKCKDERVVMLNENHFTPRNRMFCEILLDSLYNYGFRYFGMEAVFENETVLNDRGFATTRTGFYTREPMMANLIRKAIHKGYYVFGYDDFTSEREREEAVNIYNKTFAKDSLSRVLIFAGFGHINEAAIPKACMAREFFILTGIDPLTIEQQLFATEDAYLMVLDTTTLKNRNNVCDIFIANNIDYELFANKSGYKNYSITIPEEVAAQAQTLMFVVSIYKADEYEKDKTAIPVYNYLLNNDLSEITIKLPEGRYCYVIRNRYGDVIYIAF